MSDNRLVDVLAVEIAYPSQRNGWVDPREVRLHINGEALIEHLGDRDLAGLTPECLPPDRHLLGQPRADLQVGGRAALLVCPSCGDLGCGAVVARIEVKNDIVIWDDFAHANNYDPAADEPLTARFEFDRGQYEAAVRSAVVT